WGVRDGQLERGQPPQGAEGAWWRARAERRGRPARPSPGLPIVLPSLTAKTPTPLLPTPIPFSPHIPHWKRHIRIAHEPRPARQPVAGPDQQEQRDADVRGPGAHPVDPVLQKGLVILAQCNDQAERESEQGPEREKGRNIRQVAQLAALRQIAAAKAIMADGDPQPGDETGHARSVQQPDINRIRAEHEGKETERRSEEHTSELQSREKLVCR